MTFIRSHLPCPDQDNCGSSDAAALDDRDRVYCFACTNTFDAPEGYTSLSGETKAKGIETPTAKPSFSSVENLIATGDYKGCPERGITEDTARFYKTVYTPGKTYYAYFSKESATQPVAIKMRYPDKAFPWVGEQKRALLFGQQNFSGGGKYVTITEGEEDCMAVYQLMGSKYPAVSIKNGASDALSSCRISYEWLDSFEGIVICFDSDEPGQKAAKEVAQLFGGKAKIMKHPAGIKDACEYYQKDRTAEFMPAFWRAERFVPDGIILAGSLREKLKTPKPPPKYHYPWKGLDQMMYGINTHELITWCAGTGVGKSAMLRELVYHMLTTTDAKVGMAFLEEDPERTLRGVVGLHMGTRIHLPGVEYDPKEVDRAFEELDLDNRVALWDHWGSTQVDNVISRLKYFVKALGCEIVVLDHISIVVSGSATQNERQTLDELMTRLRSEVVQATGCSLHVICHLTRPDGKPLENGAQVTLSLLRGSGAIAQLSDGVIAGERDTQADDPVIKNTTIVRGLKGRLAGDTGVACHLLYDKTTGRMTEIEDTL